MDPSEYFKILRKEDIARRYFVMNSFDGALTICGVIIAIYLSGINEAKVVIISCLGAAIAMLVSGFLGAYSAEKAERHRSIKELEKHLLRDLDRTIIEKKFEKIAILVALVDGFSPLFASLIIISPFIISQLGLLSLNYAFVSSMLLVITILFFLGIFVAKVGEEKNLFFSGIKMVSAGFIVGIIIVVLEFLKII